MFMITNLWDEYLLRDIELLDKDGSPYHLADAAEIAVASELVRERDLEC